MTFSVSGLPSTNKSTPITPTPKTQPHHETDQKTSSIARASLGSELTNSLLKVLRQFSFSESSIFLIEFLEDHFDSPEVKAFGGGLTLISSFKGLPSEELPLEFLTAELFGKEMSDEAVALTLYVYENAETIHQIYLNALLSKQREKEDDAHSFFVTNESESPTRAHSTELNPNSASPTDLVVSLSALSTDMLKKLNPSSSASYLTPWPSVPALSSFNQQLVLIEAIRSFLKEQKGLIAYFKQHLNSDAVRSFIEALDDAQVSNLFDKESLLAFKNQHEFVTKLFGSYAGSRALDIACEIYERSFDILSAYDQVCEAEDQLPSTPDYTVGQKRTWEETEPVFSAKRPATLEFLQRDNLVGENFLKCLRKEGYFLHFFREHFDAKNSGSLIRDFRKEFASITPFIETLFVIEKRVKEQYELKEIQDDKELVVYLKSLANEYKPIFFPIPDEESFDLTFKILEKIPEILRDYERAINEDALASQIVPHLI